MTTPTTLPPIPLPETLKDSTDKSLAAEALKWRERLLGAQAEIETIKRQLSGTAPGLNPSSTPESSTASGRAGDVEKKPAAPSVAGPAVPLSDLPPELAQMLTESGEMLSQLKTARTKVALSAAGAIDVETAYELLSARNTDMTDAAAAVETLPLSMQRSRSIPGTGSHGASTAFSGGGVDLGRADDFAYYEKNREAILAARRAQQRKD